MFALFRAMPAAVGSARETHVTFSLRALAALAAAAGLLASCAPATVPIAAADPADPAAKVARVGYRSTTAPYTSLRPSTPAPWRERNGNVTPQPKPEQ
jgi:ABC-type amino acid transport substrate-binding protein